jgi:Putative Ig domain/IPT/TIG domain/Galactose oxidase, central domain
MSFLGALKCRCRPAVAVVLIALVMLLAFAGHAGAAGSAPTWAQLSPSASPSARSDGAAAYDPATGQLVLFGGAGVTNPFEGDTWVWNGSNWLDEQSASGPAPREGARMVYDPASNQLLLFGGYDGVASPTDAWAWTGSAWVPVSQSNPTGSPAPIADAAMAYDPALKLIALFGGAVVNPDGSTSATGAMWVGNGFGWAPSVGGPSPRTDASMGWDPATGQMVLFGGQDGAGNALDDTWVWNNEQWVQAKPASSPGARSGASLVYDGATGQMLLIGGVSASGVALGDVWSWSGSTWTRQSPRQALTPGRSSAMADYDASSGQLVLFGGLNRSLAGSSPFLGDTWVWTTFKVTTGTLGAATVGMRYSTTLQAIGGTAPLTWSVVSGSLPAGLTLSPAGVVSGSPQAAGSSTFTVSVRDSAGHKATKSLTLTVYSPPLAAVWVSNAANSELHAYALNANGNAQPLVSLGGSLTGLSSIGGMAIDSLGTLYVSNAGGPSITVYAPGANGNAAPQRTIAGTATGLVDPAGIALDGSGRLYVADPPTSSVTVYPAGASGDQTPLATIGGPNTGLRDPIGVTIDAAGHIWVLDSTGSLLEYAANANGDVAPLETISGPATALSQPFGLAQDSSGRLLVSNSLAASVTEFANAPPYGDVPAAFTIGGSAAQFNVPEGLDTDAVNDVYLANLVGGVNVYPPGSDSPSAIIAGGATGLANPYALAVTPPMTVAIRTLPMAALGRRYATHLFAALASPPLRWRLTHGRLPPGLHLSPSGRLSGTPRRLGGFTFTVQVSGSSKRVPNARRILRLVVGRAPTLSALTPQRGATAGGTLVTIHGSGFATAPGATVIDFGRLSALRVRCRSHTTCTVRTPAHAPGSVRVTITVRGLITTPTPADRFIYRAR